ncbi:MAG: hypothetical protein M3044_07495 [Thermoproteota archaeon]|nr:hypothetical protein [Thermoproteota archaeon]
MTKTDVLKGVQLVLKLVNKRLHNSTLLLNSDYPYDAFILYSFAYEEFGKAVIIKDYINDNKDGLHAWLFRGKSAHEIKMARAKKYLPDGCRQFTFRYLTHYRKVQPGERRSLRIRASGRNNSTRRPPPS